MNFTPICKLGSVTDTVADAIGAFAGTWFDTPRKAINIVTGDEPLTATFQLKGGYRTYRIAPTVGDDPRAYLISVTGLSV